MKYVPPVSNHEKKGYIHTCTLYNTRVYIISFLVLNYSYRLHLSMFMYSLYISTGHGYLSYCKINEKLSSDVMKYGAHKI